MHSRRGPWGGPGPERPWRPGPPDPPDPPDPADPPEPFGPGDWMPDRVGQVFQRLEVFRDRAEEMLSRAER